MDVQKVQKKVRNIIIKNYKLLERVENCHLTEALNCVEGRRQKWIDIPSRGFRISSSDLNLSPSSWLVSWLNVLRRYWV
jgi:hypothetical protein